MLQALENGLRLAIVLPAHDEEATVGGVVRTLREHPEMRTLPLTRIVVVDNASTDATAQVARAAGAEVVYERRRGYGAACLAGVLAADDADVVLLMDADGSDDLTGATHVARLVLEGTVDLAMGSRTRGACDRGALTPQQRIGNALAATILRLVYGLRVSDLGPTRAIRRQALLDLQMGELGYGWSTEMLAKAARAGLQVREIPVDYHRRAGGRSKVAGTLGGTLRASVHILRTLSRYAGWRPATSLPASLLAAERSRRPEGDTAPLMAEITPSLCAGMETEGGVRRVLAIVARVPVAGQTKTRLGRTLGHETAAELYRAFLTDLGARFGAAARRDGYDLCWLYSAPGDMGPEDLASCVPPGGIFIQQEGEDFAARLWNGTRALAERGYTDVAVISSDSPHLPARRVTEAFYALGTSRVAVGPAFDGGYYLLAQRTLPAPINLFTGIQMSTATVCAQTLERASELGLDVTLLRATFDVDEPADLEQLRAALENVPSPEADLCPATLAALRALPVGVNEPLAKVALGGER
jgi:rSAM/selenodomain-associated transferase 1